MSIGASWKESTRLVNGGCSVENCRNNLKWPFRSHFFQLFRVLWRVNGSECDDWLKWSLHAWKKTWCWTKSMRRNAQKKNSRASCSLQNLFVRNSRKNTLEKLDSRATTYFSRTHSAVKRRRRKSRSSKQTNVTMTGYDENDIWIKREMTALPILISTANICKTTLKCVIHVTFVLQR